MSELELLKKIAAEYAHILGGAFVGMYIHGSLAFGCYNPNVSDLDFIVIVNTAPSEAARIQMIRVLLDLEPHAPAKGFEMSVVLEQYCREFVYPTPYELHYSISHREKATTDIAAYCRGMRGVDKDLAAHFTVLRAVGLTLCGPSVAELFGDVPRRDYIDSLIFDVGKAREEIVKNPTYMTLNLCRVLAYLRGDGVLSKEQGGTWGLAHLPTNYHSLIYTALNAYSGQSVVFDSNLDGFAVYMLNEIRQIFKEENA